jgi:hypothetical protein
MRKRILFRILVTVLLALIVSAWHILILYPDVSRCYVKISLKSSIIDMTRLYYDRGSGLNESDSRSIALAGDDRFHDYLFMLPNEPIQHLRFDPPNVAGYRLIISHLALVDSSENLLQIINLDQLLPANQIKSFDLSDSKLVIVTGDKANDPQVNIVLPKPFKPPYFRPLLLRLYGQIFLEFLILCGIIWMLTGLIGTFHTKDPRIAALLIAVILLCGWRCWILYKNQSSAYVDISIKSNAFGTIQLFYDTGKWFIDANSVKSALWGDNRYHHYQFTLPNLPIYAFRFNPLTRGGVIAIKDIQIMDGFGRLLHSIDTEIIKPSEQITDFNIQNQEFVFEARGEDYAPKLFIPLEKHLPMNRIITLADFSFLSGIVLEFIIFACLYFFLSFLIKKWWASIEHWLNQSRIVPILLISLLLALLLPALWYSLNTPFALVDDYGISCIIGWIYDGFGPWLKLTFLGDAGGRYRPIFELYNFLSWFLLGPRPALHHAARWLIQFASFYFIIKTLIFFSRNTDTEYIDRKDGNTIDAFLPMLTAAYIFLLFPNQPAARLGPQEVYTVFFLTLANLGLAQMFICRFKENSSDIKWGSIWILVASSIGLSMSKEVNVILLVLFLTAVPILFAGEISSSRFFVAFGALLLILLFTIIRVYAAAKGASYGVAPLSWDLMLTNAIWIGKFLFQTTTSPWLTLIFVGVLIFQFHSLLNSLWQKKIHSGEGFFILLLYGELIILFVTFSTSWTQVIRYWYPLVPILASLMPFGIKQVLTRVKSIPSLNTVSRPGIILFLLFFAFVNYHNFLMQYATQHYTRNVEKKMLDRVTERIRSGDKFVIHYDSSTPEIEMMAHSQIYFTRFLPHYFGINIPIQTEPSKEMQGRYYTIARHPSNTEGCLDEIIKHDWHFCYWWLYGSSIVSGMLQDRSMDPFVVTDWVSVMGKYRWYIYRGGHC